MYPDRGEFVPPGFAVARRRRKDKERDGKERQTIGLPTKRADSPLSPGGSFDSGSNFGVSSATTSGSPHPRFTSSEVANFNESTPGGERVYICFRRSREGNPLTAIAPVFPTQTRGPIPPGYTVVERSVRNRVANLNSGNCRPALAASNVGSGGGGVSGGGAGGAPPVFLAFR